MRDPLSTLAPVSPPAAAAMPATVEGAWLAGVVARLGLESCARLLLDLARPFGAVGAGALWLAQPTLALVGLGGAADRLAHTLDDAPAFDALITQVAPPPEEAR